MTKAIKFAWTYGHLRAEAFETLERAIRSSIYAEDWGHESLHHIDYGGEMVTRSSAEYVSIARYEAEAQALERAPRATHTLRVKSLEGKWATVASRSKDEMEKELLEWLAIVDRKRLAVNAL